MNLFGIIVPPSADDRLPLYLNINGSFDLASGEMARGCSVTADSYFGCFSASKYAKYTNVTSAECLLVLRGRLLVELLSSDGVILHSGICESKRPTEYVMPFSCSDAGANTVFYPRVTALSDDCAFYGGLYRSAAPASSVRVAVVVCTYRREEFVLRNAERIERMINDPSSGISDAIELFVVDNGQTLEGRLPDSPRIHLFYNKNTGGSGGFTRGMIEVMKRREDFTHILLTDDDIEFDDNVLLKTVTLLKLLKPAYADMHIAGGMLRLHDPVSQFEAGARREGMNLPNNSMRLDSLPALLENDREQRADYGGWWYFCMPVGDVGAKNLPMPYFIKDDDVEFSLRNRARILVMNGIGVWHQDFGRKYIPYIDYYIVRNGMITNAIHGMKNSSGGTGGLVLERICRSIIYRMPQANKFFTMALRDYLKGPDFLLNTDCEQLNKQLRAITAQELPELVGTPKENRAAMLRAVFTASFWRVAGSYIASGASYLLRHRRADREYRERSGELTSLACWENILELR